MELRYLTAGESHGPGLTAIVEGLPANLELSTDDINRCLARRQEGYGRGGRMKIERDQVVFMSGVRWGKTLGSPITLSIQNRDWENWQKAMSSQAEDRQQGIAITHPRPGHADLSGVIKYRQDDARNILERSSARETAARVAVGALCATFLRSLGIEVLGYVTEIGGVCAEAQIDDYRERFERSEVSPCRTYCATAEQAMIDAIDKAKAAGDSLGGVVEVAVLGLPVGLGSHVHWDKRLDGRLAGALMSIQAFKGVEVGLGFEAARRPGSQVHDEIVQQGEQIRRRTNRAGGLEGGMTNGEPLVVRGAMKPIPTLYQPLQTIDLHTKEPFEAVVERSDVCAVPAAAIVAEAVVAIEVASAMLQKFGGDAMEEIRQNLNAYQQYVQNF
ncbi:chorismate synthase [Syntrophotalea acetylenivorans]|uniref:Chorismate synthase n=1 Tax=Syntrophotalea acetylenivorans TaxID=1842532 RepID=A0A1L3GSR3_9BACT|nr:chorismate synthase [Syntrophotalea acetylenivorans]APG28925.1 chorismate synthase [Syntrophotalea acetylenivorans]